jgi:nicotinamidase/pyrazinamidase
MNLEGADALIIVDVQRDFLPGGRLAVPAGDAIIPAVNRLAALFKARGLPIYATRDWHPADHCSFVEQGGSWPRHCVAGTSGAEKPDGLNLPSGSMVVVKAATADADAYSGFQGTNLAELLKARACKRVFIVGLATDYCVSSTAADALKEGFEVVIFEDAVRAVDVKPGDGDRALAALVTQGARRAMSDEVIR